MKNPVEVDIDDLRPLFRFHTHHQVILGDTCVVDQYINPSLTANHLADHFINCFGIGNINLEIKAGEVHAIMGPNGSGKSTLSQVLAGNEAFEVTEGEIALNGENLLELETEERAREGIFLAFQYPVEIPGVSNLQFLRTAVNAMRQHKGQDEMNAAEFMKLAKEISKQVDLDPSFLKRGVNEGFSGGEKKRNEILQALLLQPKLAILDETDSGLDIDALKVVSDGVNALRAEDRAILMVTHYQRLLNHIVPDYVHVLAGGKIIKSGGRELALELEERGYGWLGIKDEETADSSAN